MKVLVFSVLLAVAYAAPLASPDSDDDSNIKKVHHFFEAAPSVVYQHHQQVSPAVGFTQVLHPQNAVFKTTGHQVVSGTAGAVGTIGFVPGAVAYTGSTDVDDDDDTTKVVGGQIIHHAIGHQQQLKGVAYHHAVPSVATVHQSAAPVVSTYNAAQYVAHAPAVATHGVTYSSPAVATSHAFAAIPAVSTHAAVAAPAVHVAAAAPAVAVAHATPVHYQAEVKVSEPVVTVHQQAIPSSVTYQSDQVVHVGTKEVDVPVQINHVHVPVEKRVHYGVEKYVAGSTSTIHKPSLTAPAIAPPAVFATKNIHAAPEVTVQHSEVTVEEKTPNYVHATYDAGVEVEKAPDAVEKYDVPTPVEVPQPFAVAQPYGVPVAHPVKIKSEVKPVVNVDVHHHETQNVVTPIEYADHHVATPVFHAAAVAPAVATQGHVLSGHVAAAAPAGLATQGHFYSGQLAAAPAAVATHGHVVTGHAAAAPATFTTHGHVTGHAAAAPATFATHGQFITGHAAAAPATFATHGQFITGHAATAPATHGQLVNTNVAAAAPNVVTHGEIHAGTPFAVAYGAHGAVGGQHTFVSGTQETETGNEGTHTITYESNLPVHGQFVAHNPTEVETSYNKVVRTDFVQDFSHHAAAPVAVIPNNE